MKKLIVGLLLVIPLTIASSISYAAGFGSEDDLVFAKELWQKLEAKGLNSTHSNLYLGGPPHGKVREVLEGEIDGKRVIVKRNYGGKGVSMEAVETDRAKFLKAITVMMKKDAGYDSANADWFWVKYKANGSLHKKGPKGLAGKVKGCISCHQSASGNDLVFIHNKEANADVVHVK